MYIIKATHHGVVRYFNTSTREAAEWLATVLRCMDDTIVEVWK
jgi:hypothetical protein